MTIVKESMKSIINFNNFIKERTIMCEEEVEERLLELVKAIPYNKLVIEHKDRKWTYKFGENFTFIVEGRGTGGFSYFEYTLNGVDLSQDLGYVISRVLNDKAIQKSKDDYTKALEKLVEEIQK